MTKKLDSIWPFLLAVENYLRHEPAPREKKWKERRNVAQKCLTEIKKKMMKLEGIEGQIEIMAASLGVGGRPICAPFPQHESLILIDLINLPS